MPLSPQPAPSPRPAERRDGEKPEVGRFLAKTCSEADCGHIPTDQQRTPGRSEIGNRQEADLYE